MKICLQLMASYSVRGAMCIALLLYGNYSIAQTNVGDNTILETTPGFWVIAPTGKANYCMTETNGNNGKPLSKCTVIGQIGTCAAGFQFILNGTNFFAINKCSGAIVSCTFVLMNGAAPTGGCAQVSTLSALR